MTLIITLVSFAQDSAKTQTKRGTSALFKQSELKVNERLFNKRKGKLKLGGYAELDYNQGISQQTNGKLNVHRLVMFMGYQFGNKMQFISEIEIEHVKEVYVEQPFLRHK